MFQIIIIFLVISFIQSIIKAINQSRSTQPGTGGQSTSFSPQDIELTEEGVNRTPPRNIVNIDKPILKEAYRSKVGAQTKSPNSSQGKKVGRPLLQTSPRPQAGSQEGRPQGGLAKLTPDRLVEGIILSEILGPPKSRR
ncbi:MAG: hypothetical protein GX375_02205 [Clostridiales bacterium]|nr:hypothetical protein [Clostridiales bacterium]